MKKIVSILFLIFSLSTGFAQTFQATIQPLAASGAGVIVFVNTSAIAGVTGKVSSLTITIAIPVSVGARPPISVDNTADPFISYDIYNAVDQTVDGSLHYIYNVLGTGDVSQAGATKTFTSGADVPLATINFNGNPAVSSQIKMVSLPDGGIDPNPNSYFGFSIDGADVVDEFAMFYGLPLISEATNDGQGYAGTSFARTVPLVPLPVKFVSFNAVKNGNNAELTWKVENESVNADHYEIERSFTGTNFRTIGSTLAKNNGYTNNSYSSLDYNLSSLASDGKIYYRIKQVDKDGKFAYTEIRSIRLDGKTFDVSVYPNPIVTTTTVYVDLANADKINIRLLDASGKIIQNAAINGLKGLNSYNLNMAALSAGTYMIKVESGNQLKTIPVVKSK